MDGNIKKTRGDFGENAVCDYLFERGYEIIARNYRKKCGEIDIIATFGGIISFTEVKTRRRGGLTDGFDAITKEKQRRIVRTAKLFLEENPRCYDKSARFGAARVIVSGGDTPRLIGVEYRENAFDPRLLD
ncbi:MAG: YraN family protein [Oscillospiraceae bacterium]|jgi:putative endonuclease|nr:YraN family protein [Oscillospiraceae bacterium]